MAKYRTQRKVDGVWVTVTRWKEDEEIKASEPVDLQLMGISATCVSVSSSLEMANGSSIYFVEDEPPKEMFFSKAMDPTRWKWNGASENWQYFDGTQWSEKELEYLSKSGIPEWLTGDQWTAEELEKMKFYKDFHGLPQIKEKLTRAGIPESGKAKADPFTDLMHHQIRVSKEWRDEQQRKEQKARDDALPENPALGRVWGDK